jgi:hypothetical protein
MALRGGSETDDSIAEVCGRIYDDEFNHMLLGIIQGDDSELTDAEWDTLVLYTVEQMKLRIIMRNAQFSHPVPEQRLQELLNGKAAPVKFDYQAAKDLLGSQA